MAGAATAGAAARRLTTHVGVGWQAGISDELAGAWDDLAQRTGAPPHLRPGYFHAWWRAFGTGRLDVLTAWRDNVLDGVVPLSRSVAALTSPTNWHTQGFEIVHGTTESLEAILGTALDCTRSHLTMSFVDPEGPTAGALRDVARRRGFRYHERVLERSPVVDLRVGREAFRDGLRPSFKRELRRRRRRLEELAGPVHLVIHDGTTRLEELLSEGFRVEAAGWKGARGTAINADADTELFYREVARWAAPRGYLRLAFLRAGDRAAAFDFALEDRGAHWLAKTGYLPDAHAFAPGQLMREAMLDRAFAQGLTSYEFLGRDDRWKLEWTRQCRPMARVQAFSSGVGGRISHLAQVGARPVVKRARDRARAALHR